MIRRVALSTLCAVALMSCFADTASAEPPGRRAYYTAPRSSLTNHYSTVRRTSHSAPQNLWANHNAYGRVWGGAYTTRDWNRFYHYPYVYYPQNFWGGEYFRSANSLYHRYPPEMRIPVYNRKWQNFYPRGQRYHFGHHFMLDVF